MNTYITNEFIGFGEPDHYYARRWLETGVLDIDAQTSGEDLHEVTWLMTEWVVGRVILCPGGRQCALGRPDATPDAGCLEVSLAAPGNPDHWQYAAVAPSCRARGMTVDEVVESCRAYISGFSLGGGNWGKRSGVVSQYIKGKKKKVGYVNYNGSYETVKERAAFEKMLKEKYGSAVETAQTDQGATKATDKTSKQAVSAQVPRLSCEFVEVTSIVPEAWEEWFWSEISAGAPFSWGDLGRALVTASDFRHHCAVVLRDTAGYGGVTQEAIDDFLRLLDDLGSTYVDLEN